MVTTWLGRSSPRPSRRVRDAEVDTDRGGNLGEGETSEPENGGESRESAERRRARDWGRFTRNFVVQGTAAEWALTWIAGVRLALADLAPTEPTQSLPAAPDRESDDESAPRLAFFLHDELVVHTPVELVDEVVEVLRAKAREASQLLFGALDPGLAGPEGLVPLDVAVASAYDEVDRAAPEPSEYEPAPSPGSG